MRAETEKAAYDWALNRVNRHRSLDPDDLLAIRLIREGEYQKGWTEGGEQRYADAYEEGYAAGLGEAARLRDSTEGDEDGNFSSPAVPSPQSEYRYQVNGDYTVHHLGIPKKDFLVKVQSEDPEDDPGLWPGAKFTDLGPQSCGAEATQVPSKGEQPGASSLPQPQAFVCDCGKAFPSERALSGHKAHCLRKSQRGETVSDGRVCDAAGEPDSQAGGIHPVEVEPVRNPDFCQEPEPAAPRVEDLPDSQAGENPAKVEPVREEAHLGSGQ